MESMKEKALDLVGYNNPYTLSGNARWVVEAENRKPDDPVILYLHGGGYVMTMLSSQLQVMMDLYRYYNNNRLSILALDYSCAPGKRYPTALQEAAQVYHKLAVEQSSTRVIIMGDSAGGNLAIGLVAHIAHGHPECKTIGPSYKPYATILVSPWVNLDAEYVGSYVKNVDTDFLDVRTLNLWASAYCTDLKLRQGVWVSPVNSTPEFWTGVLPEKSLILWGGAEVMKDDCKKWCGIAKVNKALEEPNGDHDTLFKDTTYCTDIEKASRYSFSAVLDFLENI